MFEIRVPTKIQVVRLPHAGDLPLPAYATEGAAGMDLLAAVVAPVWIVPRERRLIPTGIRVAIPDGYEMQLRPRSGLALKHGLHAHFGTVDSDYRGEISVLLFNLGPVPFEVTAGMRIAQAVIAPVVRAEWDVVDVLPDTVRGAGGFGSTDRG